MNAKKWKLYRKLTKLTYASGIIFLLVGMVLSAVNQPVLASSNLQQGDPTPVEPGERDPGKGDQPDPGDGPGIGQPPREDENPGGELPPVGGKPPVMIEVPEKGKSPNAGQPPVKRDTADQSPSSVKNLSTLGGASLASPQQAEWGNSSLSFVGGCTDSSCNNVSAQVCNVGDGEMTGTVDWELYYIFEGNPKDGEVLATGTLGPLGVDECATLSYNPNNIAGNYMFRADQEAGHPGTGELWSSACTVGVCQLPTETVVPEIEGSIEFTASDTAICQYEEGWIEATVRVSLPEGVSAYLQTQWYVVNPADKRTSPVYDGQVVSNGDEVSVDAFWPGVSAGDQVVEIHWGARLSLPQNGIDVQLDTAGLDYYWYPWVCQQVTPTPVPFNNLSLTSECGFANDEQIQWKVTNPNSYPVEYTWEVEGSDESGSGTADPGDSFFTTTPGIKTVRLYVSGELNDSETSADSCKEDITVNYACTENGVLFTATNPNDFEIALNFELDGVSGSATLPANGSASVALASPGAHTLSYNWTNGSDSRSGSVSSPSDACVEDNPEPGMLSLSYLCVGDGLNWTVTNPNNFAVTFSWEEVGGTSGSDTVGANSSLMFFTSDPGTTTINLSYVIEGEQLSGSLSNGDDYCQTIPTSTPTPVTPTPTVVAPTATPGGQNPTPTPGGQNPTSTPNGQDPDPASTPTPIATLAPPAISAADAVLIPVTGADLSTQGRMDFLKDLSIHLGLVFLGLAFVFHGVTNKFGPF